MRRRRGFECLGEGAQHSGIGRGRCRFHGRADAFLELLSQRSLDDSDIRRERKGGGVRSAGIVTKEDQTRFMKQS